MIRAPFAGEIQNVRASVGDRIDEFTTVLEIRDPSELQLRMEINAADFEMIQPGQGAWLSAVVDQWDPAIVVQATADPSTQGAAIRRLTYTVQLQLAEPRTLRPGQRLSARVVVEDRPDTLTIPAAGLREFRGRAYVRVLDDHVRREVDVEVGIRTATEVEILGGLQAGELVIGR